MAKSKKGKPRIITETVDRMNDVAARLQRKAAAHGLDLGSEIDELRAGATELDTNDARETKKDPSKRKWKPAQGTLGLPSA